MIDQESSDYMGNFKKQKQKHFPCLKKRKGKKNLGVLGMFVEYFCFVKDFRFLCKVEDVGVVGKLVCSPSQIIGY